MRSLYHQIALFSRTRTVLACAVLGGLAAAYLVGYRPTAGRLGELQGQIAAKRRDLTAQRAEASRLPILTAYVATLQKDLEKFDKKLPRQHDVGQFITDVTQISQVSAVKNFSYEPLAARKMESPGATACYELPIAMKFEGSFTHVAAFLRQVEDMQRLTRVRRLNVRNKDLRLGTVEVELALNIYYSEG